MSSVERLDTHRREEGTGYGYGPLAGRLSAHLHAVEEVDLWAMVQRIWLRRNLVFLWALLIMALSTVFVFTRTPIAARSRAIGNVMPTTPPFEAE